MGWRCPTIEQRVPGRTLAVLTLLLASCWSGRAPAQDRVSEYREPILIVETDGHHAPIRSLIWRNQFSLISGGHDKVVRFWDFRDNPRLVRTLRPVLWRGPAGSIYTMALTPRPDDDGQSLLAVAGYGAGIKHGDITVYRVPGLAPSSTGEVVARLVSQGPDQPIGHRDAVLAMAFDPNGRILASAGVQSVVGSGVESPVILWDASKTVEVRGRTTFAVRGELKGHTGGIRQLAFIPPDGRRLVTVSEDGSVRLWDTESGKEVGQLPRTPANSAIINALAVSPDGMSIVIGREDGAIHRLDAQNLRQGGVKLHTRADQGAVEFLGYLPNGRQLIASIKNGKSATLDPMSISCDLELRDLPDGNVVRKRTVPGLVQAVAFRPAENQLAYSGGMSQAVFLQDLDDWQKPPLELKGLGTTIFDLGFRPVDQVIGFTRTFDPANLPELYDGFDVGKRQSTTVPRGDLQRAIKEFNGWKLTGDINAYHLDAVNADGRSWRCDLDKVKERLWWSHTFIPPGPGHPRPTVAVGCETGVILYDLATGQRTRMFAGHTSPVVSVVPSPDGHWLASSSIDQTILLYPLAGCDQRQRLGAKFQRQADGSWSVVEVAKSSYAENMGLMVGDVVVYGGFQSRTKVEQYTAPQPIPATFWPQLDQLAPNDTIALRVRRKAPEAVPAVAESFKDCPSTKRDNPVLMLMLDVSREWVLWTPRGYYDTSIEGDTRLLGWHKNPEYDLAQPTDFVPVATFAEKMMRPDVLDRLWTTHGVVGVTPAAPIPDVVFPEEEPPKITFEAIAPALKPEAGVPWVVRDPKLRVLLRIQALGTAKLGDRKITFDGRVLKPLQPMGPGTDYQEELELDLTANRRATLLVTATNDKQRERPESIELEYQPPVRVKPEPPMPKRLIVLSLGADTFPDAKLPAVRFAAEDARGLADFLSGHMVTVEGIRPETAPPAGPVVLTGEKTATAVVRESLDQLVKRLRDKQLNQGDIVAVIVSSHILDFNDEKPLRIAVYDTQLDKPAETMISVQDLSELFGQLTDYGCRVILFLDGVHGEKLPAKVQSVVKPWVRDLQRKRGVITFVASKEGPSAPPSALYQNGVFAHGLFDAMKRANSSPTLTLEQFQAALIQSVLDLTNREQQVGCYVPTGLNRALRQPFVTP